MATIVSKDGAASGASVTNGTVPIEIAMKPEELFPSEEGRYLDVASTNSYVLAERSGPTGPEFVLFNEANRPVEIPKDLFPSSDLTAAQVVNVLQGNGDTQVALENGSQGMPFSSLAARLGLINGEAAAFREALQRSVVDGALATSIDMATLQGLGQKVVYTPPLTLTTDSKERYFCLSRGDTLHLYRTVDEDMRPLSPDKWKRIDIPDRKKITADQISDTPVLAEFESTDRGDRIPGVQCSVCLTNGVITVVDNTTGTRIVSEAATCYAIDPVHKGQLFFVDAKNLLKAIDLMQYNGKPLPVTSNSLNIEGNITKLRFDPHGNFLVAVAKAENTSSLCIIEKDTRKVAAKIDDVDRHFDFNRYGEIYFIDGDGKLRAVSTNLNLFSPDGLAEAREAERRSLESLVSNAQSVRLPEIPAEKRAVSMDGGMPDAEVAIREQRIKQATESLNVRLMPEVEKAASVLDLEDLAGRIEIMKQTPEFRNYPQVFSDVEERVAEKIDTLETERLVQDLDAFSATLSGKLDTTHLTMLHEKWAALERDRRKLVISNAKVREAVDRHFSELKERTTSLIEKFESEVTQQVQQRYAAIEKTVRDTEYLRDFNSLKGEREVIEFETLVASITDSEIRKSWRSKYHELLRTQEEAIRDNQGKSDQQQMTRVAETLDDAKGVLADIKEELAAIMVPTELVRWRHRNPLVLRYRALVLALPENMQAAPTKELETLLEDRRKELVQVEGASLLRTGGKVTFKNEEFPIFPEIRLIFRPYVKTIRGREDKGELVFRDTAGREYAPDCPPVPFDVEDPETKKSIDFHRPDAESYFNSLKPPIPQWDPKWVINDWVLGYLDQIAEACREQLMLGQGIVILEGEGGCGKDVLWKMFANLTKRGLSNIPFNIQTEKEDIMYDFQYDPDRGTVREPSEFLQSVQIPGTVVVGGEINTAAPGVLKMLNSAMDSTRKVANTPMDRTVLLAGTMNPLYYLATQKISPEILSRANVIRIGYPPLTGKDGRFLPYEAEMMSKNIPELADVPQKEFYAMWDYLVNHDEQSDGERYLTTERKELINHLFRVVKTANRIREEYSRYHRGDPAAPQAEFVFSLRETGNIAARLRPESKVSEVIKRIVLPKIADPEEEMRVELMIDNPDQQLP